ncbi:sulfotransferase family protein [Streptomyces sp. KMM 9044]|uniref:sulfotransferase family protein n=1 Tax=Streptomyces sp. KMM 9044 TaxID=2744474 RepID=UPI002151694D|nr:sulfotransferase family protein [Streptomyces sp. KMM 9044]WAX76378.1 sulfotransferase family protein [Streptomyces sp. KMM 9044]
MLKLINAGLGRTGTTSLQVALEQLGYGPCYHMFDIVGHEKRLEQWERIICDEHQPDWEAVFDGYTSAVDGPPSFYYRQITEAFPDAKVVLTVRDADGWYESTYNTLYQFVLKNKENPSEEGSRQARVYRMTSVMTWDGLFDGRFSDKDHAIKVYHRRNQEIMDAVPADNLLVYDVKQGWEPLCAFLGTGAPAAEFPHVNTTANMRERMQQMAAGGGPLAPGGVR